jgi:hypothetical protein
MFRACRAIPRLHRWDTTNIVDTPNRWEITLRLQSLTNTTGTILPPASVLVDVTPRRLQQLHPVPSQPFVFYNLDASSNVVQSAVVVADELGLVTVVDFQITAGGNRLVLAPENVAPVTPTTQTLDLLLTWPGASYERFGVEYRVSLTTGLWVSLTANLPATSPGTNTTFTHSGALNGASGFYRVQRKP